MEVQRQVRRNFSSISTVRNVPLYMAITSHLDSTDSVPHQSLHLESVQVPQKDTDEDLNDSIDNDHIDGDFDFLTDIEEDKEIYRLKVFIFYKLTI